MVNYIWAAFCRLSNRRTRSPNGDLNAITFLEIKAWKELFEVELHPWEIEALVRLDEVFLKVSRE